jgi:polygalacturonase
MVAYLLLFLLLLAPMTEGPSVVSVISLGAASDGTHPAETTEAFRRAFANDPNGKILVPSGIYLIDNSTGPLTIHNFGGRLEFEGAAQLVFTDNSKSGMLFAGGSGATISGLRATYVSPPSVRLSPNEEIKFSGTTNTVLKNAMVENSPAAGILFYDAVNPYVTNLTVINSLADGLNFSNCENARVTNLLTRNTGDDGLAFVNYSAYPNLTGGLAENVVVTDSKARGIAVAGQSNVTVNGFQIRNTSSSGLLVTQDIAAKTRVPSNVYIENGTIYNAGTLKPLVGNQYGIEFNGQESVTFADIAVFNPGNSGLSGTAPSGSVRIRNVTVNSPLHGLGFLFYRTRNVQLTGSTSHDTPSYGVLSLQSNQVVVKDLTVTNAAMTDPLRRAVWFEDTDIISATSVNVVSEAGMANVIGCYDDPGHAKSLGFVKMIKSRVNPGGKPLAIENGCSNVRFSP